MPRYRERDVQGKAGSRKRRFADFCGHYGEKYAAGSSTSLLTTPVLRWRQENVCYDQIIVTDTSNPLHKGNTQRVQFLLFLLITFGASWILWIPLLVPSFIELLPLGGIGLMSTVAFGPMFGALAVVPSRRITIGNWFAKRLRFRVGLLPYLLAFGLPVAIMTVAGVLFAALGGEPLSDAPYLLVLPVVFAYATLIGGGQEEIGWRGIAQPLAEGRYGVFIGGAVVGLFWVLWHLPLFLSSTLPFDSINPIVFGFQTVGISVLLAWLYHCSGQSVLLTMMFHGWRNSIEAFYSTDTLARSIAVVVIWAVVRIVAAVGHRRAGHR